MGNTSSNKVHFGSVTVNEVENHDRHPVPQNKTPEKQLISFGLSHMSPISATPINHARHIAVVDALVARHINLWDNDPEYKDLVQQLEASCTPENNYRTRTPAGKALFEYCHENLTSPNDNNLPEYVFLLIKSGKSPSQQDQDEVDKIDFQELAATIAKNFPSPRSTSSVDRA